MSFNKDALTAEILLKLSNLVEGDISAHMSFAEKQTKAIAKQSAWIAETSLIPFGEEGGFDDRDELDWFVDNLTDITANFVKAVVSLTIITLEKAWNAIVETTWGYINNAISAATGIMLPIPVPKIS
jgi:hypothetical protein